jgi:cation:H+ antiporter
MLLASLAVVGGLLLLVWSADRFVEGAVAVAAHYAVPPLLIGMIIIGFGTSAPEMMVSTIAASNGNPGLALGNAYGSNIANIGLILGMTAMICPIAVQSVVVKKEIPILVGITGLSALLLIDGDLSRIDAFILLGVFVALMAWSVFEGMRNRNDAMGLEMQEEIDAHHTKPAMAFMWILVGLALLIGSSHLLVWGAVEIATGLGVSDLVIGLTVVAVGTSLPEFAASMAAARKGQADLALGNILGSNLFNTLVVVGIAGVISPFAVPQEILDRDIIVVGLFTVSLFVVCFSFKGTGIINRLEGTLLLAAYVGYTVWLIMGITGGITGG